MPVLASKPRSAEWTLRLPAVTAADAPELAIAQRGCHRLALSGSATWVDRDRSQEIEPARLLDAFLASGDAALSRLRGHFSLAIWDVFSGEALLVRDPMGRYPLFYARRSDDILLSGSVAALARSAAVPSSLNASVFAEYFCGQWTTLDETYYANIYRVPPGCVVRFRHGSRRVFRYWNPESGGNWATPQELAQFEQRLEDAVAQPLEQGPSAIFLSGGLDSVAVAAIAAERCRQHGHPVPRALSLAFPDAAVNEEPIQRGVASSLSLPQDMFLFDRALNEHSLVEEGLELSAQMPQPLDNIWLPAYRCLFERAHQLGCSAILTGTGGDEWLGISPLLSADLIRQGDWDGFLMLWRALTRSNGPNLALRRNLLWRHGLRPILREHAMKAVHFAAPALLLRKRERRILASIPHWAAPDPAVRRRIVERTLAAEDARARTGSYYGDDLRESLDHPLVSMEAEEHFDSGRRFGVPLAHPFLDDRLVDLLYRVSPRHLMAGGRTKGLVRQTLARRFPGLGFERQRKVDARRFAAARIYRSAPGALARLGGVRTLHDMGVVSSAKAAQFVGCSVQSGNEREAWRVWSILNLETWARNRW
ncbi:MAG: asparagine synthase-related protein [Bryobacteraceae bacterium]